MQINSYTDHLHRVVKTGDITDYLNEIFGNIVQKATIESVWLSEDELRIAIENMCQDTTHFCIPEHCWMEIQLVNGKSVVYETQTDILYPDDDYLVVARSEQPKETDIYYHVERTTEFDKSRNVVTVDVTSEIRFICGDHIQNAKLCAKLPAELDDSTRTEQMMHYLTETLDSEYDFYFNTNCWLKISFANNIKVKVFASEKKIQFEII